MYLIHLASQYCWCIDKAVFLILVHYYCLLEYSGTFKLRKLVGPHNWWLSLVAVAGQQLQWLQWREADSDFSPDYYVCVAAEVVIEIRSLNRRLASVAAVKATVAMQGASMVTIADGRVSGQSETN